MASTSEQRPPAAPVKPDLAVMRAMAHPVRMKIMDRLNMSGPATATELAGRVDLSPSATSYHLRALAKAGLIEEAEGRGDGRERTWQSKFLRYEREWDPDAPKEVRDAERGLVDALLARDESRVRRYLAEIDAEPAEWYNAGMFSQSLLTVTADELNTLNRQILALLEPYFQQNRPDPPPAARMVTAQVRTFPLESPLRP
jgi:DNA-binding transcriptional ArsR family regulator